MYLHYPAKLIYLAHPHTASKSTAKALCEVGFVNTAGEPYTGSWHGHHLKFSESGIARDGWTIFCAVRNHWDTVVSWLCSAGTLAHFGNTPMETGWTVDQVRSELDANPWVGERTMWHHHLPDADIVVRFESMEQEIGAILERHGVKAPEIPYIGAGQKRAGRPYQMFYDDVTRDYVGDRFAGEIGELGYTFGKGFRNGRV